jgi:hypothetical protein
MSGWEVFQIWLGAFLTLAMFSFLYKDNPVYKAAEHIFAGITAGYYVALYLDTVVYQQMFVPLTADFGANWRLFIPGALGLLIFARLWPKLSWLSRFGLAFMMGSTAGIFLASELHGKVLGQISGTMQIQQVHLLLFLQAAHRPFGCDRLGRDLVYHDFIRRAFRVHGHGPGLAPHRPRLFPVQ